MDSALQGENSIDACCSDDEVSLKLHTAATDEDRIAASGRAGTLHRRRDQSGGAV